MPSSLDDLRAALAGRYEIERELGRGGMATVFLANDLRHHRQVAVKVMHPDLAATLGADRFLREIEVAAQLTHPHILPLYDSGEAGGFLYYVMPYIEGLSLRERLTQEGVFPIREAAKVLREVVDALASAHKHGLVHRDIKPENVMLSQRHALVMDFGIAKAVSSAAASGSLTQTGVPIGTPAYMAPEQVTADPQIDHRADIYAFGVLAYELFAGRRPFIGATAQEMLIAHLKETPEPLTSHRADVPPAMAQLVMKCLEKDPDDRWQSTEELLARLELLATPSGGMTPTDSKPLTWLAGARRKYGPAMLVGALVLVAGVSVGLVLRSGATGVSLDPNMLAVAPFDEIGSGLEGWGEGLSDVLANALDGAGPLRTVSPSVVVGKWSGRADPTSAAQLGASLGAGLAVYGRLMVSGGDSVRLAATLFDVASQNPIGDIEVRNHRDNIDRLADSMAVRLLGELSRVRQLGAVQLNSLGSSSPAAIKAFLQGERHYRRTALDSAEFYYQRALELDTAFALAYNRLGSVTWWSETQGASSYGLFLQAGALNRGLSLRESLLVAADSIYPAVMVTASFAPDSTSWAMMRRLFATLERADRTYPNDPQIQYRIGEARLHLLLYWRKRERLGESFARAVELDSTFAPAYLHLIELQASVQDSESARQSIAAYLALEPTGARAEGARIIAAILDPARGTSAELESLLDTASVEAQRVALEAVWALRDSAETAIRIARSIYDETSSSGDSASARRRLASALAFRGHLQEAREITGARPGADFDDRVLFTELALLGEIPQDMAAEVFGAWQEAGSWNGQFLPMSWWTSVGDTASLTRAGAFFESQIESDTLARWLLGWATWSARKANFYRALARRDTTEALRLAERFPEYTCHRGCYYQRLTKARLLAASGRDREAAQLLDEVSNGTFIQGVPGDVLWQLERARVYERLGDKHKAISDYAFVADVWRHADDVLQPFVAEAREALVRLTGESN